jgi:mannose-6-phosphate isomerase-like protein (cupin superfamily)
MRPKTTDFPEFIHRFPTVCLPSGDRLNLIAGTGGQVAFIQSGKGNKIPLHRHKDSWTILVSGQMRVTVGETVFIANRGDHWFVTAGTLHGGEALSDSLIVEIFSEQRFVMNAHPRSNE